MKGKGFVLRRYSNFLGYNDKDISSLFVFDFENDCYYYNAQDTYYYARDDYFSVIKLKDNKKYKIFESLGKTILDNVMIISDESFNKMINQDILFYKQHYYHNALKELGLEEFII